MERDRVTDACKPREEFLKLFKKSVMDFEPGEWKRISDMDPQDVFEERKGWSSSRIGVELTDLEYLEEWARNPNLGPSTTFELGVAYGRLLAFEEATENDKTSDDATNV